MAKRKILGGQSEVLSTPSKKSRKSAPISTSDVSPNPKAIRATSTSSYTHQAQDHEDRFDGNENVRSHDSKTNGTTPTATPSKRGKSLAQTPSRTAADQSAKKKSAKYLAIAENDENDWEKATGLANEILDDERNKEDTAIDTVEVTAESGAVVKKPRGRPKGAKNKRSPTPEGDLPPEERYFFQTRTGPTQLSSNSFSKLGLLSHDEYFDHIRKHKDGHEAEMAYLLRLHSRSFPQWLFELEEGFSLCLYGLGSKRPILQKFAQWLNQKSELSPLIVIINGYTPKLNIRSVLNTIYSTVASTSSTKVLTGQLRDILDSLLKQIQETGKRIYILVNSLDGPSLRRGSLQALFATLAAHESIHFVATTDTPTFQLLWNSNLKDQFRFVYHDATTFAPYDSESSSVDDVNELLGRKGKRAGGKEGIGFVLKSLPENARNLYRVLLTEILTIFNDGLADEMDDDNPELTGTGRRAGMGEEIGIEYRALYQKASEEFICSSDMNFRFLLKEFHDHQMITSRRDGGGTEILGVPLMKDEMEAVLEDLVVG